MTNNIQGNSYKVTADFSAETLQARREWHDILKVMKEKNLQLRLLYLARISFRFNGEIKSFTDKQKLNQHHQTSSTTNAKGTSLSGKHNRRKGPT